MRAGLLPFVPLALGCAAVAFAQSVPAPLPPSLSGRWTYSAPNGRTFVDYWSVRFDSSGAPGAVNGMVTWRGLSCGAKDEPVTGTWNGTELRFEVVLRPNVNTQNPNGNCGNGRTTVLLTRNAGATGFEGTATQADRNVTVAVNASP